VDKWHLRASCGQRIIIYRCINFEQNMKKIGISLLGMLLVLAAPGAVVAKDAPGSDADEQSYIVVFQEAVANPEAEADDIATKHQIKLEHVYSKALKGFSGKLSKNKLARLQADPRVAFVSENGVVEAFVKAGPVVQAQSLPTGVDRIDAELNPNRGIGVGVAVIDTGIDLSHPDLAGGAVVASKSCIAGKTANDDNGHGSHVAGTIAARGNTIGVVGVAPRVNLIAVKVLNAQGSGTWSQIICGIDWVTANASKYNIKVANMSLGGGGTSDNNCGLSNNDALHYAICRSRNAGVTYVVAAGNSSANTNTAVPAGYDDAVITVSALADSDGKTGGLGTATGYGSDDTFASFSNYGTAVDIAAPGVNIYSTYKNGTYATLSGTSMASPHVAAAAALYIKSNPGKTWLQVRDALKAAAEPLGSGHTDPSGKHPEPVLKANSL
jgi:subtilisin